MLIYMPIGGRRQPAGGAPACKNFIYDTRIVSPVGDILVPYDGSETAKKALAKAEELAKEGDRLVVLHVIPLMTEFASLDPGLSMGKARKMVDSAIADLKARSVNVAGMVKTGNIADEILNVSADLKCTLIVIGSTGRSTEKIGRFLLGSVADKVARHATCPVLMVR